MTKIDIFSGFLGAGKTTLIKKLIAEAYAGEKLVLIENEFGEIGIDGGCLLYTSQRSGRRNRSGSGHIVARTSAFAAPAAGSWHRS